MAAVSIAASAALPRMTAADASRLIAEGKAVNTSKIRKHTAQKRSDARLFRSQNGKISTVSRSAQMKAPARATAKGANLFGYVNYADGFYEDDMPVGLYEFQGSSLDLKWLDPLYQEEYLALGCGWYRNGRLCGYAPVMFGYYVVGMYYYDFDFETGEFSEDDIVEVDIENGHFSVCALNESDDMIYGIGMDGEGENYVFAKAPAENPADFEIVKVIAVENEENEACPYICYNPVDQCLYGISYGGTLMRISTTGEFEPVMDVSSMGETTYIGTMAYSNVASGFYVNHSTEEASELYFISTADKTVEKLMDMPDGDTFSVMVCLDGAASPTAPAAPKIVSSVFEGASTTGTVTITMPDVTAGGDALGGTLGWTATLDRETYRTGTAAPGEEVAVAFTEIGTGAHSISFFATAAGEQGVPAVLRLYTGNDTPLAPDFVAFDEGLAFWDAVTEGVHGGYLDLAQMKYELNLNGVLYGTTDATEMKIDLPADADLASYTVSVVAVCNGLKSLPTESNSVVAGKPFTPDVTFAPTPEQAKLFTIDDSNYDDITWEFFADFQGRPAFISYYSTEEALDDWLFLPAVNLDKEGGIYRFAMNVGRMGSTFDKDSYSVAIGTAPSPAAMTQTLIDKTVPEHNGSDVETLFRIGAAGTYYIGIHANSEPNQYGVFVRDISVTDPGMGDKSPAAVTDLTATAAENGVLSATVSFRLPVKYYNGADIAAGEEVTATVKAASTTTVSGAPGELKTVEVETAQGVNIISVVTSADGENGPAATVSVYTGVDNPKIVENAVFTTSDDMLSVHITWDAPKEGANGGYIDPSDMDYSLWINDGYGYQPYAEIGHNVYEYTFTVPAGSEQSFYRLGVIATNAGGISDYIAAEGIVLGTPYSLPMCENFDEGSNEPLAINPFVISYPTTDYNNQNWSFRELSELFGEGVGGSCMMALQLSEGGVGKAGIGIPRFTTEHSSDVTVSVNYWGGNNGVAPWFTATAPGIEGIVEIPAETAGTDGWKTATAKLPAEFNGKRWVQLYLNATFSSSSQMLIVTNIAVEGTTTGVGSIDVAGKAIYGGTGEIIVKGYADTQIAVYTPDGRLVASETAESDNASIAVERGIYIVSADGKAVKVIVK